MNVSEAQRLVAEIHATWPQREMTADEIAVWCSTLAPISFEAGRAAAAALREAQDWLPTHHQFIVEGQAQARAILTRRALAEPELFNPGDHALPRAVNAKLAAWLRAHFPIGDGAVLTRQETDALCEAFDEFLVETMLADEVPPTVPTYRCLTCMDERVVTVEYRGEPGVLPCPNCRTEDHRYQNEGHLAERHAVMTCDHERCKRRAKKLARR